MDRYPAGTHVCAKYTFAAGYTVAGGQQVTHAPMSRAECEGTKTGAGTGMYARYSHVKCCTTDLCNGDDAELQAQESPAKCYKDGAAGLVEVTMDRYPAGTHVCAKYTFAAGYTVAGGQQVTHEPMSREACEEAKAGAGTGMYARYSDVQCCTTDLCNGDIIRSRPSKCYTNGPGGYLIETNMASYGYPNPVCTRYSFQGKTFYVGLDQNICESLRQHPTTYPSVKCCTSDLCNGL